MKHVKTKMLGLLVVVLLVGVGGCKKMYKCYNYESQYVVCTKAAADTVRYFTSGSTDRAEVVKVYFESQGYTCTIVQGYMVGYNDAPLLSKKDAEFWETQGYQCVESN